MAMIDDWAKANNVQPQGTFKPILQRAPIQQPDNGLRYAQGQWANQYIDSINKGNSDPQELGRYLNYKALLPELGQVGQTTSEGYNGSNIVDAQKQWYNNYNNAIKNGTNNLDQLAQYKGYSHYLFNDQMATPDQKVMQYLSIGALNGDRGATEYMKAMGLNPLSGKALWDGVDPSSNPLVFAKGNNAYNQYLADNPSSDFAKNLDMANYAALNKKIENNEPMSPEEQQQYQKIISQWNLDDHNDPYWQYGQQLQKDKQSALDAQDVALNNGMAQMDANSFNQMQQLQQQMSDKGMGDSGIAADAYMRAVMGNNQNYQQAFADAATKKSDIQKSYDDAIQGTKIDEQKYVDSRTDAANKNAIDQQNAYSTLLKAQSDADKNMTDATGMVYVNGKPLMNSNGQPISSLEYMKLSETQRHDIAEENNVAIGNQLQYQVGMGRNAVDAQNGYYQYQVGMDRNAVTAAGNQMQYAVGMDSNNVKRMQISADLSVAADKLKYDYATLDLKSTQVQADIQNAAAKLDIMSADSSTKELSAKANILKGQLSNVQSQINAYIKSGATPPDDLKNKLADIMTSMTSLASQGK